MSVNSERHVIVIGSGIIGLSSAYFLHKEGFRVTVVDENSEADTAGCSYGNAGFIVPSHFVPLAAPGVISQGLKWMMQSDSPFYVKPRLSADLIKWVMHFNTASTKARVDAAAPILRDLNLRSSQLYQSLSKEFDFGLEHRGLRMMYKTEACKVEELEMAAHAAKLGIETQELTSDQVQAQESELKTDVLGAVVYPGDSHLLPSKLMAGLKSFLVASKVEFLYNHRVTKLNVEAGRISSISTSKGELLADEFVLAAGSWSAELAKEIGLNLPLQAGKGYNITINKTDQQVSMPTILCEAKVAVSPMGESLRFGGTMEVAGLNRSVSDKRVSAIKKAAVSYFPNLNPTALDKPKPWAGLRPCSPDGIPYIGKTSKAQNLTIACGHAMLGLSLGPVTGELVKDAILGIEPSVNLINPDRYN